MAVQTKMRRGVSLLLGLCLAVVLLAGVLVAAPVQARAAEEILAVEIHGLTGGVLTDADLGFAPDTSRENFADGMFDPTRPYAEARVSSPGRTSASVVFSDGISEMTLVLLPLQGEPTRLVAALDFFSDAFAGPGGTTFSLSSIMLEGGNGPVQYGPMGLPLPAGIACSFENQVTPDVTPPVVDRAAFDAALAGQVFGPGQVVEFAINVSDTGVGLASSSGMLIFADAAGNLEKVDIRTSGAGTVARLEIDKYRTASGTYTLALGEGAGSAIRDRAQNNADLTALAGLQFTVENPQAVVVRRSLGQSGADFTAAIDAAVAQAVAAAANGPVRLTISSETNVQDPGYLSTQALQALQGAPGITLEINDIHVLRSGEIVNTEPVALRSAGVTGGGSQGDLSNNPAALAALQSVGVENPFGYTTLESLPGPIYFNLRPTQGRVGGYVNIYWVNGTNLDTAEIVPVMSQAITDELQAGPFPVVGSYMIFYSTQPAITAAPALQAPAATTAVSPQTGDSTSLPLWALCGAAALAGLALCGWLGLRRAKRARAQ